jgi:hypothetical protein
MKVNSIYRIFTAFFVLSSYNPHILCISLQQTKKVTPLLHLSLSLLKVELLMPTLWSVTPLLQLSHRMMVSKSIQLPLKLELRLTPLWKITPELSLLPKVRIPNLVLFDIVQKYHNVNFVNTLFVLNLTTRLCRFYYPHVFLIY